MLAFSCAMLEQYSNKPNENRPSKRLTAITKFLEEAVKVVPIESVFYTIGYGEPDTAVECAKALIHANPTIPYSDEALLGSQRALCRMAKGVHGDSFDTAYSDAIKQLNFRTVIEMIIDVVVKPGRQIDPPSCTPLPLVPPFHPANAPPPVFSAPVLTAPVRSSPGFTSYFAHLLPDPTVHADLPRHC
jgi:hypothetical protein